MIKSAGRCNTNVVLNGSGFFFPMINFKRSCSHSENSTKFPPSQAGSELLSQIIWLPEEKSCELGFTF